jgi:hypothetical protein
MPVAEIEAPFSLQAGIGYERSTSPFVSISDDGLFLLVNGQQASSAAYLQAALSGMGNWQAGRGQASWSVRVENKHAPADSQLDFAVAMTDLAWHTALSGNSLGMGGGAQRFWVAGGLFRDALSLHADWTGAVNNGGYWAVLADTTFNRHPSIYTDLDSRMDTVSLTHHQPLSGEWLVALDIEAGLAREHNAHDFDDLTQWRASLRMALEGNLGKTAWSMAAGVGQARYDAPLLPGDPSRREQVLSLEFGLTWDLAPGRTLAIDAGIYRTAANIALYDNTYRNLSLTWGGVW